jgi:hypothetical protein
MSIHLMSLVWKVKFPSQTQKLLLMRLADFAHEDGSDIYPAIDTVAGDIGASRRQTQYAIKSLESCALIDRDGKGSRNTNKWKINTDLLVSLALKEFKLVGVHDSLKAVENEGAIIAPRDLLRVQSAAGRVQSATQKGAMGSTQTLSNHQLEPLSASASARDGSRTAHAVDEKPLTMFELTPQDVTWKTWISLMEAKGRTDLADEALEAGKIQVRTKWPDSEKGLQGLITDKPKKSANYTDRMLGETV